MGRRRRLWYGDGVFPSQPEQDAVVADEPPSWQVTDNGAFPHPWRGDKADLPPFPSSMSRGREKPSTAFKKWLEGGTVRMRSVRRRLAYVAMTRARSARLLDGSSGLADGQRRSGIALPHGGQCRELVGRTETVSEDVVERLGQGAAWSQVLGVTWGSKSGHSSGR